jgi:anti-sigma B factor antagonist
MPATRFDGGVRLARERAVIDLRGQIDGGAKDELAAIYERATAGSARDVLLNFTEVDYINSTGIALIVGLLGRARAEGRTLAACGLSDHYREIFEITRLSDFIALYPDETSAPAGHEEERT